MSTGSHCQIQALLYFVVVIQQLASASWSAIERLLVAHMDARQARRKAESSPRCMADECISKEMFVHGKPLFSTAAGRRV
jgi:hypothetical protein